jgi:hypothetical protein
VAKEFSPTKSETLIFGAVFGMISSHSSCYAQVFASL